VAFKRKHVKNVLVGLILVASISMSGCGVPSQMDVAISDNGVEANVLMREGEVVNGHIRKNVLLVIFDGLASTAMQRYAEKLRDNYVADGFGVTCIKCADNNDKAKAETIKANAQGRVICLMSYSNSDSVMGSGGRNAFAAWTEEQGFPVIEIRADDTWGNMTGSHVESNVTAILNIRTNTLGHRGAKMTDAALESPDTLYWDMCAPVHHIAIFGDKEYWHIPQVVCVINGNDPFAAVSSNAIVSDDPPEDSRQNASGASAWSDSTPTASVDILEEEAMRRDYISKKAFARTEAELRRVKASDAKKIQFQGCS
jgi:hypothetical protein